MTICKGVKAAFGVRSGAPFPSSNSELDLGGSIPRQSNTDGRQTDLLRGAYFGFCHHNSHPYHLWCAVRTYMVDDGDAIACVGDHLNEPLVCPSLGGILATRQAGDCDGIFWWNRSRNGY